jgi:hypothetical protein
MYLNPSYEGDNMKPFYVVITAKDGFIGCHLSASRGKGNPHAQRLIGDAREFDSIPTGVLQALLAVMNVVKKTNRPMVVLTDSSTTVQYLRGNIVPKKHEKMLQVLLGMVEHRGTTLHQVRLGTDIEMGEALKYRNEAEAAGKRVDRVFGTN